MNGKSRLIPLCTLILLFMIILSCGEEEQPTEIIRPVRYVKAYSTGGTRTRTFTGIAQAGLESKLSFKVPGTIKRIAVKVGDKVKAGDLIAQLDRGDYELQVQQAEAACADAEAKARNAKANYDRIRALWEDNSAPTTDLDASRAAYESSNAVVQAKEKELEMARLHLSYTSLTAPVNGAIAQVERENNENVQAGKTIVTLTSGSQIEVKVSIPEILISSVREGAKVTVIFDALPGREYPATITEVGVAATGMATTFPVTVLLDSADPDIRPGMAALVAFLFESSDQRERFILPPVAVGEDRQGRFIFIAEPLSDEPGYAVVRRRPVTIGELTAEGLEIFEGLTEGDLVITAGISHITEGQKVGL